MSIKILVRNSGAGNGCANFFGAGVLHKFGADFSVIFSGFHLPERQNLHTNFWYNFCADFGALIYAQIFAQIFCADFRAQIFAQIFGAQCADFSADFPQIFLRSFGALKIGVPESRKNAHKICGKICGVPTACPGDGSPLHLCCLEKGASHTIAARRKQSRGPCECPS